MQSISTNHQKSVSIDAGILCSRAGKRVMVPLILVVCPLHEWFLFLMHGLYRTPTRAIFALLTY